MELYGRNGSPAGHETGLEETMGRLGLWEIGVYPERSGVADCDFYMRNGSCAYGAKCRYNHPRDRSLVGGAVRIGGEYPERAGEPACQYYLRTGTCKFGASCKFHHPRRAGGSLSNVPINIYGYPLRPDEKECPYYLKTGQCKFGVTCKFHHPQPAGIPVPASARPFYPTVQSPSAPLHEQYEEGSNSIKAARHPLLPGSYVPSAYGPMLLPPGVVPIPNWSPYSGPVSPVLSPGAQPSIGAASLYRMTTQLSSSAPAYTGPSPPLPPSAGPSGSNQTEQVFPERPGQLECPHYMRTGECKFGSSCKYHHPPDWVVSKTSYVLSSLGLPLRPGVQACSFYLQNGYCKFGKTCKFDHPVGGVRYTPAASSLTDIPIAPYMLGSPTATMAPSHSFSEPRSEFISGVCFTFFPVQAQAKVVKFIDRAKVKP